MLARVDEAVARGDGLGSDSASRRQMATAIDEIDRTLRSLSEVNRTQMQVAARAIAAKERRFTRYAFALDGVALVIAVIATWLVAQAIRRYALQLQRRSTELEHLAVQVGHEMPTRSRRCSSRSGSAASSCATRWRSARSIAPSGRSSAFATASIA